MVNITCIDILEIMWIPKILICPGILMGNLMISLRLAKGLNELAIILITFMVSI